MRFLQERMLVLGVLTIGMLEIVFSCFCCIIIVLSEIIDNLLRYYYMNNEIVNKITYCGG